MVLHDLVNEMPLGAVAAKYKCSRGVLQSLQQAAATFAGEWFIYIMRVSCNIAAILIGQVT